MALHANRESWCDLVQDDEEDQKNQEEQSTSKGPETFVLNSLSHCVPPPILSFLINMPL